ncbi:MAG: DUF5011 domain-containing protein [Winogradskyella sp.]|uniref:immunoglobulin-like domain-containing protein n=1 Tax=Winogradskyella sp. TaxID=1883156 RepID=UPI000F3D8939|nr:immunoglobulin-like domain-containing protein [Winogradskyella sp.]RNC88234.1 MAG: DUF5011 domain-containing protein [Winogradskyella sp.]
MIKKLRYIASTLTILLIAVSAILLLTKNEKKNSELTLEEQRAAHAEVVANSPFKETLTWDKKKRKKEGLPPNRYFEQMWELTVNPSTGQLDDGELTVLREQLVQQRSLERSPGEAGNDWDERGPNDIGGRTRAILFDPNDTSNNTVYAGGVSGGLWRNTNITSSGSQWERVVNVPGNLSVTSITVDPNNSNRWYVGTGEQYTAGDVVGNGVYVTNDGGTTWTSVNIPPAGPGTFDFNASNLFLSGIFYVNDVIAWDNNGNTELFVAVGAHVYGASSSPTNWLGLQTAGLYRSTNDGATWSRIETPNLQFDFSGTAYPVIPNDFEIGADNRLWMGTITTPGLGGPGGGRVFSTTNGSTWTEAAGSPLPDSNRVEIAVSSSNANTMYALTQGVSAPVHIYRTTNAFASTTERALPNDADQGIPANDFCRGQAFYDLMIEVDPTNDNILYVGGIDIFRSTNAAGSWTQISKWSNNPGLNTLNVPLVHADQHAMTFRPGNANQAVFGTDGGIYYSSNLSSASNSSSAIGVRNNNYNVTQYVKAGIGPNGTGTTNVIFTAGAQDNGSQAFRNANASPGINGSEELSDGDGFYTFVDKDGQYMIATFVANVIYRFNLPWNGLGRRQGGATTLSNDQSRGDFVNQMDYDSDANRLLTNNSNNTQNAIKSINVASNSSGSLTNSLLTAEPSAFRASPFANNVWYVGLKNGNLIRLSNVNNNSATWTSISTPFVGSVSSIRYGATANDIFVTIHNYGVTSVWATSNGGSTWVSKEGDLPNLPVRDMLQNPLDRDEAILATQLGVWSTSNFNDANPNWTQAYNGMSDASVTSFDYWAVNGDDNNNQIIASTYGRGVFTGTFTANAGGPDTTPPVITLNGSATVNLTVGDTYTEQGATATDNVDGDITANIVIGGDTVNTNVAGTYVVTYNVSDAAGNAATQVTRTVNVNEASSGCSGGISTFPYTESFESGDGWTQAGGDDGNWVRNSGSTPSNTTGPSSAVDGAFYMFLEASTNNSPGQIGPNATAILVSPCFDLTSETQASFNFQNHMYGANIGSLSLEVSTNEGASWVSIWSLSGDQGNQWNPVSVDLASYLGQSITLRFVGTTGSSWRSDVAIDDISLVGGGAPDTTAPVITLNGASTINLNVGESYTELGATATDNVDGDITANIVIGGDTVNTSLAGTYVVTYNVSDAAGNAAAQVTRTVNVNADTTAPVITLNGSSNITLDLGQTYTEQGATATDNVDGDISANIVIGGDTVNTNVAGTYIVTYNVSDAAGNAATQVTRTVTVNPDTTAPVISLNGSSTINLTVGDTYTEQGATATDNIDGNITANIVIGGDTVNTNVAGTYVVTYNVSDAAGNAATQVTRTVNVNEVANGCSGGISTFPYSEGFESGIGAWTQSSADDLNWTVDANGTPSNNTGPSSAVQGSNYIYVEASGNGTGFPNKRAIITSPCFDLSSVSEATFSFNYHMFGSTNAGSVSLEVSDDEGASWTSLWSQTGNQGNQWLTVNIDLAAYIGSGIQLRFNRLTGGTWQADVAIDDISLTDGVVTTPSCSGGITSYPYTQGFEGSIGDWSQSNADDLNWTVDANGTPSNGTGPSSAVQGSNYIYVEASGNGTGYPNKRAIITSPCYDLSSQSSASFSFNYHMFGSNDMGSIALEASNDNGGSWTTLWSQTGNQGNQWLSQNVDLSSYVGNSIQLRFNRLTGGTWQADIAIDNVNLSSSVSTKVDEVIIDLADDIQTIENSVKFYPNPAGANVNVSLGLDTQNGPVDITMRIYDLTGKVVQESRWSVDTNSSEKQINISGLNDGVYMINIISSNGFSKMQKLMKK